MYGLVWIFLTIGFSEKDGERLSLLWIIGWSEFFSFPNIFVDFFLVLPLLPIMALAPELSLDVAAAAVAVTESLGPVAISIGFVFPRNWGICFETDSVDRCGKKGVTWKVDSRDSARSRVTDA